MKITRRKLREIFSAEISHLLNEAESKSFSMNDRVTVVNYDVPATVVGKLPGQRGYIIMSHDDREPGEHLKKPTQEDLDSLTEKQLADEVLSKLVEKERLHIAQYSLLSLEKRTTQASHFVDDAGVDIVHLALDILGLIPGAGEGFDIANAVLYLSETPTKILNAVISLMGIFPGVGDSLKALPVNGALASEIIERVAPKVIDLVEELAKTQPLFKKNQRAINNELNRIIRGDIPVTKEVASKARTITQKTRSIAESRKICNFKNNTLVDNNKLQRLISEEILRFLEAKPLDKSMGSLLVNKRVSLNAKATDDELVSGMIDVIKSIMSGMENQSIISPEIDSEGNIDSDLHPPDGWRPRYRSQEYAPPEWIKGNINNPETIQLKFQSGWYHLSELRPQHVLNYKKYSIWALPPGRSQR